ncbi:MAG TPA: S49 family peptidase [Candidatus Eisenbacteria bacterium]|nr:S49 family peptidase [Candidatus Eisenbacteria bacterium]
MRPRSSFLTASAAAAILLLCVAGRCTAWEGLAPYAEESDVLSTSPSTDDGAIGAMFNPAQWGVLDKPELSFFWSDENVRPNHMDRWGVTAGAGPGFTLRRHDRQFPGGARNVTDYQIGFGSGSGRHFEGMAFGFSGPGKGAFARQNYIAAGDIARPTRWLSLGTTGRIALQGGDHDGGVDVGIRPLGDARVTIFGDYSLSRGERWDDGPLAGGIEVRPIPGLQAALRYGDEDRFQVTVGVALDRTAFRATPHFDRDGNLGATRYAVRLNPPIKGFDLDGKLHRARRFVEIDLKGQVAYQAYRYWDPGTIALRDLTERIQFAIDDPTVGGVVLNLSGLEANPAMLWEIREKLLALKQRGKKVIVYADNLNLGRFYLASVADRLVMDPRGYLLMPGIQISRTYMKGLLAKLGLGFDEWRYYKYKSALEAFSRDDMSAADREQLQAVADAAYAEFSNGVVQSGRTTREGLDRVVNEEPFLYASRLLELKWVDELGRTESMKAVAKKVGGSRARIASYPAVRERRWRPDEEWGPQPTLALVYAIGECAMDDGIKARTSSKAIRQLRENSEVKAVVMRADSPGGDPLASDLVAGEIRALKAVKKPILVSQGRVAGSGGYWISMDADTITTTPFTVTGSIGVIGGWVWNDGFGKKTGFSSDRVQVGKSADLLGGIRLPILGATLPERNLDAAERKQIERSFAELYDDFTRKVASARRLDVARVRELGEGRIYLGRPAVENRLVDRVATLDETIEAAKRAAGIPEKRSVRIIEYPKAPLFRLPMFLRGVIGPAAKANAAASAAPPLGAPTLGAAGLSYEARVLQAILDEPGRPLLLTPGSVLPSELEAAP